MSTAPILCQLLGALLGVVGIVGIVKTPELGWLVPLGLLMWVAGHAVQVLEKIERNTRPRE